MGAHNGRKGKKAPAHIREAALQANRARALELRLRGLNMRQIAAEMRCAVSTAHDYISAALSDIVPSDKVEELRTIEEHKLDARERDINDVCERMMKIIRTKRTDREVVLSAADRLFAGHRVLNLHAERRARLKGLDVPSKHEVGGKNGAPIMTVDIGSLTDEQLERVAAGDLTALTRASGEGEAPPSEGGGGTPSA